MLNCPMVERSARLRRHEIAQDFAKKFIWEGLLNRIKLGKHEVLDLNIRVSLQPRVSFSIWVGRGA